MLRIANEVGAIKTRARVYMSTSYSRLFVGGANGYINNSKHRNSNSTPGLPRPRLVLR